MMEWFWGFITLFKILMLLLAYIASGGLASFIYTVRTLRRYPDQKSLDKTDKEGLVPVIIFSPIVLMYYLAIGLTLPFKLVVWFGEKYALKDREKRQLAEKRRTENERLASMTTDERIAELNKMIEEMNEENEKFSRAALPAATTEFISEDTSGYKRKKVAVGR